MNEIIKPPMEWPKTGVVTVRYEDEVVNNVAYGLYETYGIRKGDRVAIMATNIPEAFVGYLALSQIGAISVIWPMPGENLTEEEVKEFCKGRIADYKVPDYVAFTELPLPRNPGGKILKKDLLDKERYAIL